MNFVLIPHWGLNAAAFTTIVAEELTCVVTFYFSRNSIRTRNVLKNTIKVVAGCVVIVIVCSCINSLIINKYLELLISVLGSSIAYGIVLLISRHEIVTAGIQTINNRRNAK